MKHLYSFIIAVSLLATAAAAHAQPICPANCQAMGAFQDDFDYSFNSANSPNGIWTKQNWQWGCKLEPGMVTVEDGEACFKVTAGGGQCGQIDGTYNSFYYGRYRARMKFSPHKGVVNSIFFYGPGGESEIDIEYLSKENDIQRLHLIAHPNNGTPCGGDSHKCYDMPFDPSQDYHVYGFDIHPDRIDFFVDEQKVATIYVNIPWNPGALIFNNWAIGDWPGPAPQHENLMFVDWARYEPFNYCAVCDGSGVSPDAGAVACGDGICNGAEDCWTCPQDCGECEPESFCGDGSCDAAESCQSCSADCGQCPPEEFCGDGACNADETCESCADDCGVCPPEEFCGDGTCNVEEDCALCAEDCGECPPVSFCGDDACEEPETCASCAADCGQCPPEEFCGDGACSDEETCEGCAQDCGECEPDGPYCGDLACDFPENCFACPSDCGACPDVDHEASAQDRRPHNQTSDEAARRRGERKVRRIDEEVAKGQSSQDETAGFDDGESAGVGVDSMGCSAGVATGAGTARGMLVMLLFGLGLVAVRWLAAMRPQAARRQ